eukprot:IDg6738t1
MVFKGQHYPFFPATTLNSRPLMVEDTAEAPWKGLVAEEEDVSTAAAFAEAKKLRSSIPYAPQDEGVPKPQNFSRGQTHFKRPFKRRGGIEYSQESNKGDHSSLRETQPGWSAN